MVSVAASGRYPPVSPLPTHSRSGATSSCSQANIRAGAPEPGGDLVADQQHAVLVAQLAHPPQVTGRLHQHPGRALHERLDDHRRDLAAVLGQQRLELLWSPARAASVSNSSGRYSEWKRSIPPTDTDPIVSPW